MSDALSSSVHKKARTTAHTASETIPSERVQAAMNHGPAEVARLCFQSATESNLTKLARAIQRELRCPDSLATVTAARLVASELASILVAHYGDPQSPAMPTLDPSIVIQLVASPSNPIDIPPELPGSAELVVELEWSWSPMNSRADRLSLEADLGCAHWVLWVGYFDDNDGEPDWRHAPALACPRAGLSSVDAAMVLMAEYYRREVAEYEIERFHMITRVGLLTPDQVECVADAVWGRPPTLAAQ